MVYYIFCGKDINGLMWEFPFSYIQKPSESTMKAIISMMRASSSREVDQLEYEMWFTQDKRQASEARGRRWNLKDTDAKNDVNSEGTGEARNISTENEIQKTTQEEQCIYPANGEVAFSAT